MKSAVTNTSLTLALVTLVALFAAGCSTTRPVAISEPVSDAGPARPSGTAGIWTSFREYWFDAERSDMPSTDAAKASDVARFISENPGLQVGIDGALDPDNMELSNRRITTVRDALIVAGVPSERIQMRVFGHPHVQHDRMVEVLVSSR